MRLWAVIDVGYKLFRAVTSQLLGFNIAKAWVPRSCAVTMKSCSPGAGLSHLKGIMS